MPKSNLAIAVIAHGLRAAGGLSVATNIIRSLIKLRPKCRYLITAPDSENYRGLETSPRIAVEYFRHRSYLQRIFFDEVSLPRRLRSFQPDLIFSLGNIPVRTPDVFQALLFHNPHLVYPDIVIPRQPTILNLAILAQKSQLRRGLPFVDLVFCQTGVMQKRFQKEFGYHGDVLLLPNAVSGDVIQSRREGVSPPLPVPTSAFTLFVLTRYYAHKNLELIVECFDRFREQLHDVVAILTISDEQHPNASILLADVQRRGLDKNIVNIGPVPQALLPDYYRKTDALLLPTLLESFSGTYLEAMKFGTPILTADRDFARETCGNAALYFDPLSPEAMRDSILLLKQNDAVRTNLVDAGRLQLKLHSGTWDEIVANAIAEMERRLGPGVRS